MRLTIDIIGSSTKELLLELDDIVRKIRDGEVGGKSDSEVHGVIGTWGMDKEDELELEDDEDDLDDIWDDDEELMDDDS